MFLLIYFRSGILFCQYSLLLLATLAYVFIIFDKCSLWQPNISKPTTVSQHVLIFGFPPLSVFCFGDVSYFPDCVEVVPWCAFTSPVTLGLCKIFEIGLGAISTLKFDYNAWNLGFASIPPL